MTLNNFTKLELFKQLANYNYETNESRIVSIGEFIDKFNCLKFGNGGSWCRRSNIKNHKIATLKNNGKILFLWNDVTEIEKKLITKEFFDTCIIERTGNYIKYIKFCGLTNHYIQRPIRKDIRDYYKKMVCCACGRSSDLVCDHKNDLYNDKRVLNLKTQNLNDFQSLCNQCNLQKRQICKNTKLTGKLYCATNIPMLKIFNIDFINSNKIFDIDDINTMVGTYWYDPCEFMNYIKKNI